MLLTVEVVWFGWTNLKSCIFSYFGFLCDFTSTIAILFSHNIIYIGICISNAVWPDPVRWRLISLSSPAFFFDHLKEWSSKHHKASLLLPTLWYSIILSGGKKKRKFFWCAWSFSLQVARVLPISWVVVQDNCCRWELEALYPNCGIGRTIRCDSLNFWILDSILAYCDPWSGKMGVWLLFLAYMAYFKLEHTKECIWKWDHESESHIILQKFAIM